MKPIQFKGQKTTGLFQYVSWLILSISIGILIYSTWCGVGLTFDSYNYLSAGESLKKYGKLLMQDGSLYIVHAPLFPVFISLLGTNPILGIKAANILLFVITTFIVRAIIQNSIKNDILKIFSLAGITWSVNIHMIYNFIWTEPLFLFLFSMHTWLLLRYLHGKVRINLIAVIFIAFLMGITRNAGVFIILPSWLFLTYSREFDWKNSISYLVGSTSGFLSWNLYAFFYFGGKNKIINGVDFFSGIPRNFINYIDTISCWATPSLVPGFLRLSILIIIMVIIVLAILKSYSVSARLFLFSGIIYILIMICFIQIDVSDVERMLSIIYPWLIVGIFTLLDGRMLQLNLNIKRVLALILCIWIGYVGARTIKNSIMWHQNQCELPINSKIHYEPHYQLQ